MSAIPRPMEAVQLQRSPFERRALRNGLLTLGAWAAAIIAGIPLISVLYMLVVRGVNVFPTEIALMHFRRAPQ